MFYRGNELKRLYEIEIYEGDRNDPEATTRTETIIAWNHVDAIRRVRNPVSQPVALHFVTNPDSTGKIYRIDNTTDGPVGEPLNPSIAPIAVEDEDW